MNFIFTELNNIIYCVYAQLYISIFFLFCVSVHHSISQMKHQLDATLCRLYFCRVTLHVSVASAHHQEYLKTSTAITHVPVAAVLVLNTPDDGRLRPKHVE